MAISPKYPIAYAQYNQTIYYLFGRMMKSGKIPYIDMVDHKGIYIFLIHYLGELICEYNHIGLYLIAVIFLYVSALYIYKTIFFLNSNDNINNHKVKIISILGSISYVVIQSLYAISYGTLQGETFINAGIIISIYYFIKDAYNNDFDFKHTFLYGIVFAFILFIKANYDLFFIGIAIYIFIKKISDKKCIIKHMLIGILGIFVGLLPGLLYSLFTNSFSEMIYNTFVVNAIYSSKPYFGTSTKLESLLVTINDFKIYYLLLIIGMIVAILLVNRVYKNNRLKDVYTLIFALMLLILASILMSMRNYKYYLIVSLQFIPIIFSTIVVSLLVILGKFKLKLITTIVGCLIVGLIAVFMFRISNTYGKDRMIKNGKEQLLIANFVKDANNNLLIPKKNRNLFVLGQELYIYSHLNIMPSFKYFAMPIIEIKHYDMPYIETYNYILNSEPDVLVVGLSVTGQELFKYTDVDSVINSNYKVVSSKYARTVFKRK